MINEDKYYTELDKDLQKLATIDWVAFVGLIGEENLITAKVCLLRSRGKSLNQIANKLSITREKVKYSCNNKCGENEPRK